MRVCIWKVFNKSLEADIRGDTGGTFRNVLVSLLNAARPANTTTIDRTQAKLDAQALLNAGAKKWGTDEVRYFCKKKYSK